MAGGGQSTNGTFKESRWRTDRGQQGLLPDEPKRWLHSWRRIPLHHLRMYSTNFPRRITPWRRRRPYQHVLCALRTLGRTEQVSAEIQEDRRNRSRLHLHDIRISLQVLSTSISRRTHSGSTNNPIQFL